jgi:hypothetical protein
MAKLRMHNDITLDIMQAVTVSLGKKLRAFSQTTCAAFATKELHREYNARVRREAKEAANKVRAGASSSHPTNIGAPADVDFANTTASGPSGVQLGPQASPSGIETNLQAGPSGVEASTQARVPKRRYKTFNLNTFKCHFLGYYVETIRYYGTSDSYSSEPVRSWCLPLPFQQLIFTQGRTGTPFTQGSIFSYQSQRFYQADDAN